MTEHRTDPDAIWNSLDRQLEQIPLDLEQERDAFYSQPDWDVYRLHYTGLDGYRLFCWLSAPVSADGPVPALLRMPDYGSVHDIVYTPLRSVALVMNATHRGQRQSESVFQANYPGLLTQGIERQDTFAMMRVFADALRAVDALLGQTLAEVGPIALTGSGLGGVLAGRRPPSEDHRRGGRYSAGLGASRASGTRSSLSLGRTHRLFKSLPPPKRGDPGQHGSFGPGCGRSQGRSPSTA